jgi:ligand-binding SRPBCC domain-containing protein
VGFIETIRVATWINAPVERCFLLSLSIGVHAASAGHAWLSAKGGVRSGLLHEGETVTLPGRPFGMLRHTSRIDQLRPHSYFRDVMVAGNFRHFVHEHHFATMNDGTRIRDEIRFSSHWGSVGNLLARKRLKAYLVQRASAIKRVAESEEWRRYLDDEILDKMPPVSVKNNAPVSWNKQALLRNVQPSIVPRSRHV